MNDDSILKYLKNRYKHINFDKTFINIPGVCKTITLSKYFTEYGIPGEIEKLDNLRLYFHGFTEGKRKYSDHLSSKIEYNTPTIFLGWKGYHIDTAKKAGEELGLLLSNEVKLKEDIKLKMTSSSMGNIVSGHALSSLLNQEAVKPENITMKLFKIADTRPSLIVRNVMRLKAQDVLPNTIKTEDLKKLKIIVPHIEENFDFIHPEEAVEDFYNNISSKTERKKISFVDIVNKQKEDKKKDVHTVIREI